MNRRAVIIGLAFALLAAPSSATILLFDQQRDAETQTIVSPTASGSRVPFDYGDNVTGALMAVTGGFFTYGDAGEGFTPNVSVDLFTGMGTATNPGATLWETAYGDLVNVVYGEGAGSSGTSTLNVLFRAAPTYSVELYGFDLAGWNNTDYTIAAVDVLAGQVSLFSASGVLVEGDFSGPRHTSFAFAEPLKAPEILLRIDLGNLAIDAQDNIGIDSIRFGQVPEAGAVPMGALGIAALLFARRNFTRR